MPAEYAAGLHARYSRGASEDDRRELGQYFTPVAVARMMAELGSTTDARELRILEPGAGAAVLTAALCEGVPSEVKRVHIDTLEIHPGLGDPLEEPLRFTS